MIKVTLILPEKITRRKEDSESGPELSEYEVNQKNLKRVLGRRKGDLDEWYFDELGGITVVDMEEMEY